MFGRFEVAEIEASGGVALGIEVDASTGVPAGVKARPALAEVEPFKTVLSGNRRAASIKLPVNRLSEATIAKGRLRWTSAGNSHKLAAAVRVY